jgi:hypothetical protein
MKLNSGSVNPMLVTRLVATLHLRWSLPLVAAFALSACGGGGGSGGDAPPPPSTMMVTISGKITFDRIPFRVTVGDGLNFASPVESPARSVVVEALDGSTSTVLASTSTNATGDYSVQVPAAQNVRIRAKAQMLSSTAPTMDFRVRDNFNGDALYVLDGSASSSGVANSVRNLRATSGWGGSSYTGTRAAAPFAILDTVYRARELVLSASANATFPALNLYWSEENRTTGGCTDNGNIGTSFYTRGDPEDDDCVDGRAIDDGIYILGSFVSGSGDTDEFDQHVIAHEFGHYVEDRLVQRSDSIGGEHGGGDRLDLRVAFSEGWGNAYSGMTLNDPVYRDSSGATSDTGPNLEAGMTTDQGWFSEASIGEIIWDVFDSTADAGDTVTLDFKSIFGTMSAQVGTDAFVSVYSFATALRSQVPAATSGINALLSREEILSTDDFGTGETNVGGSTLSSSVYRTLVLNDSPMPLCTNTAFGDYNRLDNRRLLRFTVATSAFVTFTVAGASNPAMGIGAASDPDIIVYRDGVDLGLGGEGDKAVEPIEMTTQTQLAAGDYAIEVYDFDLVFRNNPSGCMTVAVTGTGS